MLKTRNIGAYRDLLVLFTRYGLKDFHVSFDPSELLLQDETVAEIEPDVQQRANAFAEALKKMGPTYVKFGQILSTRPDIVPQEYILALEKLQDDLEPFSFAEVEKIVEEELGVRILDELAAARRGGEHNCRDDRRQDEGETHRGRDRRWMGGRCPQTRAAATPIRSWPAAWTRCRTRHG